MTCTIGSLARTFQKRSHPFASYRELRRESSIVLTIRRINEAWPGWHHPRSSSDQKPVLFSCALSDHHRRWKIAVLQAKQLWTHGLNLKAGAQTVIDCNTTAREWAPQPTQIRQNPQLTRPSMPDHVLTFTGVILFHNWMQRASWEGKATWPMDLDWSTSNRLSKFKIFFRFFT